MTTRYQNEHYEDVAGVIASFVRCQVSVLGGAHGAEMADAFANLFTADNPRKCLGCGLIEDASNTLHQGYDWGEGFDRERFLAACGLP